MGNPRNTVRSWRRAETGMSEIAGAIVILPLMAFLIFALIETGINLHYRTLVDNATQTTVREISQDGALYWARTSVFPPPYDEGVIPANGWQTIGEERLAELCGTNSERCTQAPTMDCSVQGGNDSPGYAIQLAPTVNTPVTCTATFYYNPVSPLSNNPATSVGFSLFLTRPMTITIQGNTTVGEIP